MSWIFPHYELTLMPADFGTTWYDPGFAATCTQTGMSAVPDSAVPDCAVPDFLSDGFVAGA
jgi:hypothetical protein